MPTRDEPWTAGTPNWIDLGVDDIDGARAFYSALFGWQIEDAPEGADAGGYLMAMKDGRAVAGLAAKMEPNPQTYWNNYLASDDVDATAQKITAAGGQVIVDPMNVADNDTSFGRMLVAVDPNGAPFSVWEAKSHIGAGIYNETGSYIWNENLSSDPAKAKEFYAAVFGYSYSSFADADSPDGVYEVILRAGGSDMNDAIGGLGDSGQSGGGNFWLVWFAVDDTDASAAQVAELGGEVVTAPFDSPEGRMALVKGSNGELFGIMQPKPPEQG